ncbi:MAG: ATP-binding protein [Ruminococcaceae bacterium]|nr:ATP-binding protein [Oscillospiraceae bacterium]
MSEKNELSVYDIYSKRAEKKREEADERSRKAYLLDPRIEEIEKELSKSGIKLLSAALHGDENQTAYEKIQSQIRSLRDEKKERLIKLGLPEDYTDVKYDCEKCSDTGYVGIKMCDCLRRTIIQKKYETSGIGKYLQNQNFDNFDLSLYPFGKERESMTRTLDYCKNYAETFSADSSPSLLFVGGTGLGKTHLSSAIAQSVIDKGNYVCYESAHNIISVFERERFSPEKTASDKFFQCDLLIIDDLGAEIQSKSSVSYFYTLINTRLISSKPTIISTNLSATELKRQYEDRIVSRLFGEYSVFLFEGEDIRKIKR